MTIDISASLAVAWNIDGDEILISGTITNLTPVLKEYKLFVYDQDGSLIKVEPIYWKNIDGHQTGIISMSSKFNPRWDIHTVFPIFQVALWEQHDGFVIKEVVNLTTGKISSSIRHHASDWTTVPVTMEELDFTGGIVTGDTSAGQINEGGSTVTIEKGGFGKGISTGLVVAIVAGVAIFLITKKMR